MIHFKSKKFFYDKEMLGSKPNTVRTLDESDSRFDELINMIQTRKFGKIRIHLNTDFEGTWFERDITDVSYWDELFIISWDGNCVQDGLKAGDVNHKEEVS